MSGLENSNKILKMEINARIPNAAPPIQGEMSPLGTLDRGYAPAVDTTNSHVHNLNPMGNAYSDAPVMGLLNHSQNIGMLSEKVRGLNQGSSPNTLHSVPQSMYFSQQPAYAPSINSFYPILSQPPHRLPYQNGWK